MLYSRILRGWSRHFPLRTTKHSGPTISSSVFDSDDDKEAAMACMAYGAAMPFLRALLEYMLSAIYLQAMPVPTRAPLLPRFLSKEFQVSAVFESHRP